MHADGTVTFTVWAPHATALDLFVGDERHAMSAQPHGWWSLRAPAGPGDRYGFSIDGGPVRPDPASRRQPDGVHESSAVVDVATLPWSADETHWRPVPLASVVIYELHIGTFSREGTFDGAIEHLADLADLGVTHVEVMPVAAFNGDRGWGYDGVAWYAVHEPYGGPEAFARFVDACHRHDLAVVLDVVYNHLGPSGNYLPEFGPYLTDRYDTPWGQALNLDGPGADQVRAFIIGNALHWLADFHVDALRLDAVHGLIDISSVHILGQLSDAVADLSSRVRRPLQLIAETDRQDPSTIRPREAGGLGIDAQWHDELHHALHVALTGESDGYYADFRGLPDVAACYERGFVFDGRYSQVRGRTVGAPLQHLSSHRLVACLQNHDQVGNRPFGDRLTTMVDAARLRTAAALLVTSPETPMLFMGEEYGETRPFRYFTSHPEPDLAQAVREGRRSEFAEFTGFGEQVPDPQDPATFEASKLDRPAAGDAGQVWRRCWADLLAVRRGEPALASGRRDLCEVLVADDEVFAAVRRHPAGDDVVVVANLGDQAARVALPAPARWAMRWCSDDTRYGGQGLQPAVSERGDTVAEVPPRSACILVEQA